MKAARRYVIGEPAPIDPNKIIARIKFASAPSDAIATRTPQKFGKKNHWAFEWDDASIGSVIGLDVLNGSHYTDGCGNNINYSGTLAINGANEFTPQEYPLDGYAYDGLDGRTSLAQMADMINAGWEISDHSYYHDADQGKGLLYTAYEMTVMMQDYIKSKLNYWTRTKVVPTAFAGNAQAAFDLGYLYSTSQSTFDSFTAEWPFFPPGYWDNIPTLFKPLRRDFTDDWPGALAYLEDMLNDLMAQENAFFRIGSHVINETDFASLVAYIQDNANDEVLVSSTREWLEYDEMSAKSFTQNLVGDTLIIETDISTLDPKNRWKDQCFDIEADQNIISIETVNADGSAFNNTTGLVNVFKQTNIWL